MKNPLGLIILLLSALMLAACYDMPVKNPLATSTAYGPDGSPRPGTLPGPVVSSTPLARVGGFEISRIQEYAVTRDEANGALIYLFPNGSGVVWPFTATPGPTAAAPGAVTAMPGPTAAAPGAVTATPGSTTAAPRTATATTAPTINPISNGNMEAGLLGWTAFVERTSIVGFFPEINVERLSNNASPFAVHSGDASLRIVGKNYCYIGGFYQIVDVTPGQRYTVSAWSMVWANQSSNFNLAHDVNVFTQLSLGLDAEGDIDPTSSGVRWTFRDGTDDFRQQSVSVTALGPKMTIYLRANLGMPDASSCKWPLNFMLAFFDDVELEPR
jgi:hypothetical protein